MSNTTRKPVSRQLPAVHGTAKVLQPIGSINADTGEIEINGKPYFVRGCDGCYSLFGFDARKGETTHYDVSADCKECDCADATYRNRPGGCKHCRALSAMINAGKLPKITPV